TVYGIAGGSANVSYNFVTANIDAETVWAIAPTHNNCYFIGETTASGINRSEDDSTTNYIIVIETNPTDDRVIYTYFGTSQDKTYFTLDDLTTNWEIAFTTKTHFNPEREGWAWEESLNSKIVGGLTVYFPYFTIDGEPTMIIAPSQIVAKIDSEYIKEINSVYVELPESENPMEFKETEITETAIINYHYFEGDPSKSAQFNTYEITDLVDLQIVPEDADGGVNFVVVSGSSFAYLNGRKITFTGVTGNKEANRIVIKCYSIFNPDEYEYIVFHTQYGLSSLTVEATDINVSTESGIDYEISIINGADSTYIKVGAENIYKDESFRTLLSSGAESNLKDNESIDKFLQMKVEQQSDSNLVVTASDDMFGNFEIEIKEGVTDSSYENLKFTLCFNLTKYFGDAYPQIDGQDQFADLSSTMLRVNLIMSAKDIVVNNGNVEGDTQSTIPFDVDLFTGYIKDFDAEEYDVGEITPTFDGNVVKLAQEHDYINITMEATTGAEELATLMENAGVNNVVELFNYEILSATKLQETEVVGFKYTGTITLKNEHNFRYIKSKIVLKVTVYSKTNNNIKSTFNVTIKPTNLSTVRLSNYSTSAEYQSQGLTWLIKQTETNIISPSQNGLLVVNLEPSYANIDLYDPSVREEDIPQDAAGNYLITKVTSDGVFVPEANERKYILFEQLVYDKKNDAYMPVLPASPIIKNGEGKIIGIYIQAVSNWEDGKYTYDGKIYLRTSLDSFVGVENSINISLDVYANGEHDVNNSKIKTLTTQYLPGAYIEYDSAKHISGNDYLIEKDTYNNVVTLKLYGYEFKSDPDISIEYVDPNLENLSNYVAVRFDNYRESEMNADGSYSIKLYVDVYKDIPGSFKISVGMSLITADGLVETSGIKEIVLHPVDYFMSSKSVAVDNLVGSVLNVRSKDLTLIKLKFTTDNLDREYSSEIYDRLLETVGGIEELKKAFSLKYSDGKTYTFADLENVDEIKIKVVDVDGVKYLAVYGVSDCNFAVTLTLSYT
ncbi:MAG: hypothetical protein MJ152_02270, partial [Clostridia bacterium]|nr:hypothetical protein [Clostridia bacterium]